MIFRPMAHYIVVTEDKEIHDLEANSGDAAMIEAQRLGLKGTLYLEVGGQGKGELEHLE